MRSNRQSYDSLGSQFPGPLTQNVAPEPFRLTIDAPLRPVSGRWQVVVDYAHKLTQIEWLPYGLDGSFCQQLVDELV
jgi:hypothetical protein